MSVSNVEERIVEMETRQAFQEHTIEELNGVIISQQQQIDRLESQIVRLEKKFAELGREPKGWE
ncbi:MAG: SlyX family protein [Thermodesulfobacteriota bacterium]